MRLTRVYHARLQHTASHYALTADQLLVLHIIVQSNSAISITQIAQKSIVQQPAVTKMVISFETLGYVTVARDEGDKRKTLVEITDAGRSLVGEIQNRLARQILPFLMTLDESALKTLENASDQLVRKLTA